MQRSEQSVGEMQHQPRITNVTFRRTLLLKGRRELGSNLKVRVLRKKLAFVCVCVCVYGGDFVS